MHVLFVCTGNICRSPTAERLAASYAGQRGNLDITASSAGTLAVIGHPIHPDAAVVIEKMGCDASDFAARQLKPKLAFAADLIITMTGAQRDVVLEMAPRQLRRAFTLTEAARLSSLEGVETTADFAALRSHLTANDTADIPDPIGQSRGVFEAVGAQIAELLPPILEVCRRSLRA